MNTRILTVASIGFMLAVAAAPATAQRRGGGGFRGGGGGMPARAAARPSVTSRPAGGGAMNRPNTGGNINRPTVNTNVNRPTINTNGNRPAINNNTINVNRPVNVNDIDVHDDYHHDWGCCYHPVATAAAVTAAAVVTAAVIGSVVYSLPPACATVVVADGTFEQCGNTWYRPEFAGTTTTYVVVSPPQ